MRACTARTWICALATVLVLAASPAGAVDYEYDALGRLTKAIYENGMTITYGHDAAGNIVLCDIRAMPLGLAVGVLQNPYLTQFLDVHLIAARALDPATIRLEVGGERVPVTRLDAGANVWKGDYEMQGTGGAIRIDACATGFVGVEECVQTTLTARFVTAVAGGTLRSADERLGVRIGPGALARDAFVVVFSIDAEPVQGLPSGARARNPTLWKRSGEPLPSYRVGPPGPLADVVSVEMSYAGALLPDATRPEQLYIELLGYGPLASVVDPQQGVVRASTSELGDFVLRIGATGASRPADPRFLRVAPNVPNPFNPTTTIRFEVQTRQHATVAVFDVRGRRVVSLLDADVPPGFTHVVWDGRDARRAAVPSGVYFARVQSARSAASIRMVLVR